MRDILLRTSKDKPKKSKIVFLNDVVSFLISYCFYYNLLLFAFYFFYQSGYCDFKPLVLLASIIVFYLGHELMGMFSNSVLSGGMGLLITLITVFCYPLRRLGFLVGIVLGIFLLVEFLSKEKNIIKGGIGDNWFLNIQSNVWGIGIIVLIILHCILSENGRAVSPKQCLLYMCIVGCVYIILVFIEKYLQLFIRYFRRKKQISPAMNMQVKRVLSFAFVLSVGIAVFVIFFTQYFSRLMQYLYTLIIEFISGIKLMDPIDTSRQPIENNAPNVVNSTSGEILSGSTASASFIGKLLAVAIIFAITIVIIYFFVMLLKNVSKFNFASQSDDDYSVVWKENIISKEEKKKKTYFKHGNSINEKIRKHYYRMLLAMRDKGILKKAASMTVGDVEEEVAEFTKNKEDIGAFSHLYSAARYSDEILSTKDEEKAKILRERIK